MVHLSKPASNKNPGIAAGVLHFVSSLSRGLGSEIHAAHAAARGHGGAAGGCFGSSAIMASVVIRGAATEAAFWIAARARLLVSWLATLQRGQKSFHALLRGTFQIFEEGRQAAN
jgi:hypothetical protein